MSKFLKFCESSIVSTDLYLLPIADFSAFASVFLIRLDNRFENAMFVVLPFR